MTNLDIIFVGDNERIFVNSVSPTDEQRLEVYRIYNLITGEVKKPNSCGRCWRNVRRRVWQEYLKKVNIL